MGNDLAPLGLVVVAALLANWKWLLIAALVALMLGQRVQVSNAQARAARAEKALADYKLSVSETTRVAQAAEDRKATDRLKKQKEAADAARTRETALRADVDGARADLARLRNAVRAAAARRDPVPGAPANAEREPSTEGRLLTECAAEYQALGERADQHASDVQTLTESWPK